ncbi:hypothetical protein UG55_104111 [Frankia sp. EI5c]|uniref:hypothetical protein n=1 Tax=Frankia sp. EI5c TaxID=683316 RepID=UPI0007C27319|nr:hypothetical protein [Frankia sp. EI5c]OAA23005.1 hypothetical protein UG55_104111 [Frankia sp. EI5c]
MTSTRSSGMACRALIVSALFAGALAGCAESGADTASTGTRPMPAAAEPPSVGTTPSPAEQGAPGERAAGSDGTSGGGVGADDAGAGGGTPGTGTGTGTGTGGAGPATAPGGTTGTGGTGAGGTGAGGARTAEPESDGSSSGVSIPELPTVAPSPVFLGEACVPGRDSEPATAVNGLILYCVPLPDPTVAGLDPDPAGRWSPENPTQSTQGGPAPGSECDPEDVGKVVRGAGGRPVSCLREADGGMRWADVS